MPTLSVFKSPFLRKAGPELFVVKRDGKTLIEPQSHNECFKWLHDRVSSSVDWAIKYEGYSIDPARPGDGPNIPDFSSPEDQEFLRSMAISGSRRRPDYGKSIRSAPPRAKKAAHAVAEAPVPVQAGPRTYAVTRQRGGNWYIQGLTDESGENVWIDVSPQADGLALAEQIYKDLYAEFQTNENLKDGDLFDTPVGRFICQGTDVLPHDAKAKQYIAQVDELYKCAACGCDQGRHRQRRDENGELYYAECSQHPECRRYSKKQRRMKYMSAGEHSDDSDDGSIGTDRDGSD